MSRFFHREMGMYPRTYRLAHQGPIGATTSEENHSDVENRGD